MNKKYIDFVPTNKRASTPANPARSIRSTKPATSSHPAPKRTATTRTTAPRTAAPKASAPVRRTRKPTRQQPQVVYRAMPSPADDDIFGVITPVEPVENHVENSRPTPAKPAPKPTPVRSTPTPKPPVKKSYQIPKSPFINQASVTKRPLSKNVYHKKIEPTKEPATKQPVAIIAQPEKDKKSGLIIGIILTIILGAAAGTIAFLLLPK